MIRCAAVAVLQVRMAEVSAQDGTTKMRFQHIASEIGALEAEEVGVEHLLRDVKVSLAHILCLHHIIRLSGAVFLILCIFPFASIYDKFSLHLLFFLLHFFRSVWMLMRHQDSSTSTLANRINAKLLSLRSLESKIGEIEAYLQNVTSGKLPINNHIINQIQVRASRRSR
jgi:hypothetical protein